MDKNSLAHTRWEGKYHIVFAPKFRRKIIYNQIREDVGRILRELCDRNGEIKMLVNGAGVSPSQTPIEAILNVDLYGTAVLLEEVGKVIAKGGCGVTISSQSGWRMPQLTQEEDAALATSSCFYGPLNPEK